MSVADDKTGLLILDSALGVVTTTLSVTRILGIDRNELRGVRMPTLVVDEDVRHAMEISFADGKPWTGTTRLGRGKRPPVACDVSVHPIHGSEVHAVVLIRDLEPETTRIDLIENERRHTGRELHDGICQTLSALVLDLVQIEDSFGRSEVETQALLQDALGLVRHACEEARRIARGLRPALLDQRGLEPALAELVRDFEKQTRVGVTFEFDPEIRFGKVTELLVYRTIQEALTNVRKHASAQTVRVQVRRIEEQFEVSVTDDGQGPAAKVQEPGSGLGIAGLRERAAIAGASFELAPAPGRGTRLLLRFERRPHDERPPEPEPHAPRT